MTYVQLAAQALLAVVFAWAAISKLHSRQAIARFAISLRPLTRRPTLLAAGLTGMEVVAAVLLVFAPGVGFAAAVGLLSVLSVGIAVILRRGVVVRCRCFGAGTDQLGRRHLARNLALLGIAVSGQLAGVAVADIEPFQFPSAGFLVSIGAGVVIAPLFVWFDDLVELFR